MTRKRWILLFGLLIPIIWWTGTLALLRPGERPHRLAPAPAPVATPDSPRESVASRTAGEAPPWDPVGDVLQVAVHWQQYPREEIVTGRCRLQLEGNEGPAIAEFLDHLDPTPLETLSRKPAAVLVEVAEVPRRDGTARTAWMHLKEEDGLWKVEHIRLRPAPSSPPTEGSTW